MAQLGVQATRLAAAAHRGAGAPSGARRARVPGAAGARDGAVAVAVVERADVELVRRQEQGDDVIIFTFGTADERAAAETSKPTAAAKQSSATGKPKSNVVAAPARAGDNGKVHDAAKRSSPKAAAAAPADVKPAWWTPPPAVYVEAGFRREIQAEAQAIASRMLNAKQVGQAFTIRPLVTIRQLCADTGATIDTRPHTDAIYRFAADAAANSSAEQGTELSAQLPGRFLSGLAMDLGIEEAEAVDMVSATVASRARAALITACAGYREGDNNGVLVQLLKLAGLVTALPLPPRSPHAETVATAIQQRASLEERQAIFLTYGCMDPASAEKVAELLGFEPELVLPQLEKRIAESRGGVAAVA